MGYAWIIEEDFIDYGEAVGVYGPRGAVKPSPGVGSKFRLLDGDGVVYAKGRFVGDAGSEDAFGPLDDYGMPNWGCTSIEYWENGWKAL